MFVRDGVEVMIEVKKPFKNLKTRTMSKFFLHNDATALQQNWFHNIPCTCISLFFLHFITSYHKNNDVNDY